MTWPKTKAPAPPGPPPGAVNSHDGAAAGSASPPATQLVRQASAPRRLPPKVVAIALAVVVLGGVITVVGVQAFSKRVTVLAMAHDVQLGSTVTAADLTTAEITSDPNLSPVPASQTSSVVGLVAATELTRGSLLTRDEVTRGNGFGAGQVLVPMASKQGQLPAQGLTPGEKVLIAPTPANASNAAGTTASDVPGSTTPLMATVVDVGRTDNATGVTVVDLRVPQTRGVAVAQIAASGGFVLIALPAGG